MIDNKYEAMSHLQHAVAYDVFEIIETTCDNNWGSGNMSTRFDATSNIPKTISGSIDAASKIL